MIATLLMESDALSEESPLSQRAAARAAQRRLMDQIAAALGRPLTENGLRLPDCRCLFRGQRMPCTHVAKAATWWDDGKAPHQILAICLLLQSLLAEPDAEPLRLFGHDDCSCFRGVRRFPCPLILEAADDPAHQFLLEGEAVFGEPCLEVLKYAAHRLAVNPKYRKAYNPAYIAGLEEVRHPLSPAACEANTPQKIALMRRRVLANCAACHPLDRCEAEAEWCWRERCRAKNVEIDPSYESYCDEP